MIERTLGSQKVQKNLFGTRFNIFKNSALYSIPFPMLVIKELDKSYLVVAL